MSPAEYHAAGLDQLTDGQRAALTGWLAKHAVRLTDASSGSAPETSAQAQDEIVVLPLRNQPESLEQRKSPGADGFGDEKLDKKIALLPEIAEAQITGDFRGWDGKTIFRLTNGQVWQQRVGGRYRYRAVDPAIRIQRARFGYYLEVVATGRKVGVKRIK